MQKRAFIVVLILLIFFVISFLTNILGPLIPDIISSFNLSVGLAGFLPFSFFVAYGVMSIPSGLLVDRYGEKRILLVAFCLAFVGACLFASWPGFLVAMVSLFLIGVGMAMLQVVINPLLREAGGQSRFAFNSVLAQLFFGGASFLSPMLYTYLVEHIHTSDSSTGVEILNKLTPNGMNWISLYWIFAVISLIMIVVIYLVKFPKVELNDDERVELGGVLKDLIGDRTVIMFFIGIFCYVGTEQGIANWTSKFLQTYHHVDPATEGAKVIAYFWGLLTIGCLLGLALLKFLDSKHVLIVFATGAMISLTVALLGSKEAALIAFPLAGFFASVMWSIIVSLALNSLPKHHGTLSGILCTGIVGGAVVPLIIGGLAELIGLQAAMMILFIPLAYILSVGFWANPLIKNETIFRAKEVTI